MPNSEAVGRTWPPEGVSMTLMALRADELAGVGQHRTTREVFEGSLEDGIDLKGTLRARIHREDAILVRRTVRSRNAVSADAYLGPSPTVFILDPSDAPGFEFFTHAEALERYRPFVRHPLQLDRVRSEGGLSVIGGLTRAKREEPNEAKRRAKITVYRVHGTVALVQPSLDFFEEALWLERTSYRSCPILADSSIEGLCRHFLLRHGVDLDPSDWSGTMIRVVIQYARSDVNVVAPDGYTVPSGVHSEARRRGISIHVLPHSLFPPEHLRKISYQHHTKPIDDASGLYDQATIDAMGEHGHALRQLLPPSMNFRSRFGRRA
jgi:hypothetical protein